MKCGGVIFSSSLPISLSTYTNDNMGSIPPPTKKLDLEDKPQQAPDIGFLSIFAGLWHGKLTFGDTSEESLVELDLLVNPGSAYVLA